MNEFSSTSNSSSLLNPTYDDHGDSALEMALKKKRLKMAKNKGMKIGEDEENEDAE